MPKWTDYTIKTEPADNDEVMVLDTAGKANKRLGLSALSDWIIGKIANKVFENLQTQNKTILGALNELNSNLTAKSYAYTLVLTMQGMIFLLIRNINMDLELFFTVIQIHAKSYYFRKK